MMENIRGADAKKIDLAKLRYWFGAPPLHVGDNRQAFNDYVYELARCMEPDDRVVEILVYRFAIESWKQMGLIRYQAQAVRSRDNARDKFDEQHAAKVKKRKFEESNPELLRDIKEENDPQFTSEMLKEQPWDTLQAAVASGNETQRAAAFEKALDVYEKIDYLINQSVKRTNDILEQVEWYRGSLAERLRKKQQMTVETLKGELAEKRVDPPLIPEVDRNQ